MVPTKQLAKRRIGFTLFFFIIINSFLLFLSLLTVAPLAGDKSLETREMFTLLSSVRLSKLKEWVLYTSALEGKK
jgi:hypothetical protein